MNVLIYETSLLAANVTLYKWLLGGGIVLMALLGLVFFGMLALQVLQQEDAPAVPAQETDDAPAPPPEETAAEASAAAEADTDAADEQEG